MKKLETHEVNADVQTYQNRGQGTLYVACTRDPPPRGTAHTPLLSPWVEVAWDPDATMWGANFGLASYSDRPFTTSARDFDWPVQKVQSKVVQMPWRRWRTPLGMVHPGEFSCRDSRLRSAWQSLSCGSSDLPMSIGRKARVYMRTVMVNDC